MKLDYPEQMKRLGALIDREIKLVESGEATFVQDRMWKQYVPASHPVKNLIVQKQTDKLATREGLVGVEVILRAI